MKRREFIGLLGGAAAGWQRPALAQQAMPVVGLLNGQSSAVSAALLAAFRQGLAEAGFVEGRNLSIVYRSAEGEVARLPALAAELVDIPVAVIAAVGGDNTVLAAKAATATIPIVFTSGSDPVETGIVTSLNRPGGNVTGATFLSSLMSAKRIGLLRDLVPKLMTIGFLTNPSVPMAQSVMREVRTAAQAAGLEAIVIEVTREDEIVTAFAQFSRERIDALVISSGVFFSRQREQLIALAAEHAIPTMYNDHDQPAAGGLVSYGADNKEAYRKAALYVGRILRGDKPAELPVMQPTKFVLVINTKTARALGLTLSPAILALADEVIE
jgi:putative ABC transport system substrate-binding protein